MDVIGSYLSSLAKYLPVIIAIGGILFGGIAFWMWRSGYNLPRFMDLIRPNKERFTSTIIFCKDGEIRNRRLSVGTHALSDHFTKKAYYSVRSLRLRIADSMKTVLPLSEWSPWPIDFNNRLDENEKGKHKQDWVIFCENAECVKSHSAGSAARELSGMVMLTMALCITLVICVIGLVFAIQQGGAA